MRWLVCLTVVLAGCGEFEGDDPGECSDGADNDRNGLFDCFDGGCAGSSDCDGTVDPIDTPDTPDATPTPSDTDVQTTACGTWDGTGERPPGPHEDEIGLVSAWEQYEETVRTSFGPLCLDPDNPDWAGVFAQPTYDGEFVYNFFRLADTCTAAEAQQCPNGFPQSCVPNDVVWVIEDHVLRTSLPPDTEPLNPVAAPGCSATLTTSFVLYDEGTEGTLEIQVAVETTPSCPPQLAVNSGCVITHTYDLGWVRAE
jgi:hypothetical protein